MYYHTNGWYDKLFIIRKTVGVGFVGRDGDKTTRPRDAELFRSETEALEVLNSEYNDGTWEVAETVK